MSLLQDYYPASRKAKTVYVRIACLTKDDVMANCSKMLATATKYAGQFEFDAAEHLMKHAEELRDFHSKTPEEGF